MELFAQDPDCRVLVATDAAGEGLNLQRAHLMVNYDLPWNPNRIEQRFGRIHRIGQTEVCHLWNLVATTPGRAGVRPAPDKLEEQRQAYQGGSSTCSARRSRDSRCASCCSRRSATATGRKSAPAWTRSSTPRVGEGLDKLIAERAAHRDMLAAADLEKWRARMAEARARRLQPHYIRAFFLAAFRLLGGTISERESGRYEIRHVPADIRDRDRQIGTRRARAAAATSG